MGNAGSTPSSKEQNRLSKPRTNTNSLTASPVVDRASNTTYTAHDLSEMVDDSVTCSPTGDHRSKKSARQQLRSVLSDTRAAGNDVEDSENDDLGEMVVHVRDRLSSISRSGSGASQFASARSSTTKLMGSEGTTSGAGTPIRIEDAIHLLSELSKNASPEDILALQKALQPNNTDERSLPVRPNQEQKLRNTSSTSVTRRRSLATPALATREPTPESSRTSLQSDENTCYDGKIWKLEEFVPSPLTRLVKLDENEKEEPTPRAQTPADMEYSHIGALKLGSLRITNGTASPAPSIRSASIGPNTAPISPNNDVEGVAIPQAPVSIMDRRRPRPRNSKAKRTLASVATEARMRKTRMSQLDVTPASGGPLRTERLREDVGMDEKEQEVVIPKSTDYLPSRRKQSAQFFTDNYMAEISSSPYAEENAKGAESEPAGMKEEDPSVEKANVGSDVYREEALQLLDGTIFSSALESPPSNDKARSGRETARALRCESDSGYSSGASVVSAKDATKQFQTKGDYFMSKEVDSSPRVAISPFSFEHPFIPKTSVSDDVEQDLEEEEFPRRKSNFRLLRQSRSWRKSTTPSKDQTSNSPALTDSQRSPMGKKLQKKRPVSYQVPIVSSVKDVNGGNIPDVPGHLATTLDRRLTVVPHMDHLEHTFPSVTHTKLEHEDSSLNEDTEAEIVNSYSDHRSRKRRPSLIERPPTPPPHRYPPTLGDANQYIQQPVGHVENIIRDFGTVAESLGSSPYDVATHHVRTKPIHAPTHPHQLGRSAPRIKPMVNMSDEAASDLAQRRSLDRGMPSGRGRSRPRSEMALNHMAQQQAIPQKPRPQTFYEEVPPVPRLPVKRQSLTAVKSQPNFQHETPRPIRVDSHHSSSNGEEHTVASNSWDQAQRTWSMRRRAISEAIQQLELELAATAPPTNKEVSPQRSTVKNRRSKSRPRLEARLGSEISSQSRETDSICDRFGGGLHYQYEAGYGLGGSAGTRHMQTAASRKSLNVAYTYGVDLSDVPVFVQETR